MECLSILIVDTYDGFAGFDRIADFFQKLEADSRVDDRIGADAPSAEQAGGLTEASCIESAHRHLFIVV